MGMERTPKKKKLCVRYHERTGEICLLRGESSCVKDGHQRVWPTKTKDFSPRILPVDFNEASKLFGVFTAKFEDTGDLGWWDVPFAKLKRFKQP